MSTPESAGKDAGHVAGCPVARPWLYSLDEHPLECICADLNASAGNDWGNEDAHDQMEPDGYAPW